MGKKEGFEVNQSVNLLIGHDYYLLTILSIIIAFIFSFFCIPTIIKIAELKKLFDETDLMTQVRTTPTLGGVAIFFGLIISFSFFKDYLNLSDVKYLVPTLIFIFFTGIKDDILILTPLKKLISQFICAFTVVIFGGLRINSFYGILGIQELPVLFSIVFTIFLIIGIINCYNLIDGSDGLAASLGLLSSVSFGLWFLMTENWTLSFLSFSLAGSLIGFLYYNWQPAKIFMGDTGAMLIGFVISILAIQFIELNKLQEVYHLQTATTGKYWIYASTSLAVSVMAIPLFDMIRVFVIRLAEKRSPFKSDRNHIHHILKDLGFSHKKIAVTLFLWSLLIIIVCVYLKNMKSSLMLVLVFLMTLIPTVYLDRRRKQKTGKVVQI